jgi:hypothetical protein
MRITGKLLALDLGVSTGFARGCVGDERPASGAVRLKKAGETMDVAFGNLIAFLAEEFTEPPQALVKERMLALQAFVKLGNAEATVRAHAGYHAIVEGMCVRYGVPWIDVSDSTVRKHFVGRSKFGDRHLTKAAVVERCWLLGLMPRDCNDDNRADSIACFDWAMATFAGRIPSTLHFFGEQAGGQQNVASQ